ncbi:MAG: hypothetical protein ABIV43_04170 [Candidatus Saccharimonadales bacterium]
MKLTRKLAASILLFGLMFIAAPTFAEENAVQPADSSESAEISTMSGSNTTSPKQKNRNTLAYETKSEEPESSDVEAAKRTARDKAEQKMADMRARHSQHSAESRQKFCNMNKDKLTGRFNGLQTSATAIQTHIDSVYVKVQTFVADKQLTVTDYDGLATSANVAKALAVTDIAALTPPSLDCTSDTVATTVATYKESAIQLRTDLKAYRDAVKQLAKAVRAAAVAAAPVSTTTDTTTDGSAQ